MYGNSRALNYTAIDAGEYVIADYLRISKEDDTKDESNSITNQRAFIKNYISSCDEFRNAKTIEYIDDGRSGSHTDREAYQRLISDVKKGVVNCIIVKDLSRIGRNLIEVDDLLMNYLVSFNTRFIAINNNYDSFLHPLSNLELAVINLANQHYNQDLAMKSISSKHVKMKRGEYLSCFALFGYQKSKTEKNKLVKDEESAEYVRLMFSLAMDGHAATEIAKIINAQGIPTPSEYKKRHGIIGGWSTADSDYHFWNNTLVRRILLDERYTGKGISNMYKVKVPGKKTVEYRPKDEWIIVPNAHEAIISESDFQKAHACLNRVKYKDAPVGRVFYNKIKCPICGHAMKRSGKYNPQFKCGTGLYTDHYNCPEFTVAQSKIEDLIVKAIKIHADVLIEREELKLLAIKQENLSRSTLENRIKSEQKAIRLLEDSITKNFTMMLSEKMSQDTFLSKKTIINDTIARKKSELQKLNEKLQAATVGKTAINESLSELKIFREIEKLDRESVDLLIDKILVHNENDIEIVWNGEFTL